MEVVDTNPSEEEISDSFVCCICLDLLYKPIVLSCGHISCFWCVFKSMSFHSKSSCPICRNPYQHFPTICQMLHFLLQKMYPLAYKRRELQILEEENKIEQFSPQLDDAKTLASLSREGSVCEESSKEPAQLVHSQICKQITLEDVLCAGCKQLLCRPVVLNCGHVYCESCLVNLCNEIIRCGVCQSTHPNGLANVSLELVKFLEEHFPNEYALRRDTVQLKEVDFKASVTSLLSGQTKAGSQADHPPSSTASDAIVHFGVGCDFCGMCPIIGNRYKCMECVELSGFDLCNDCYNTPSKLPGRFNQQHTSEHKFELVSASIFQQFFQSHTALMVNSYYSEDSEDATTPGSLTSTVEDNAENVGSTPNSSTSDRRNQDDSEPTS